MIQAEIMRQAYMMVLAQFPEKFNDIWLMDLDEDLSISFTHKSYDVETDGIINKTKRLTTRVNHVIIVTFGVKDRDCIVDVSEHDDLWNDLKVVKSFDIANPSFTPAVLGKFIIKLAKSKKTYNADDVMRALVMRNWDNAH